MTKENVTGAFLNTVTDETSLAYGDAAAAVSDVIGRPIHHFRLSPTGLAARDATAGLPADYAALLAGMDEVIAEGAEDSVADVVEHVTGGPPSTLAQFLASHRAVLIGEASA